MKLIVSIERRGKQRYVGTIEGTSPSDARFQYDEGYLRDPDSAPISISLPLQEELFPVQQTKNYFEGLLPEGYTRRTVAQWMHVDENDYLSILHGLGRECLGAIQIRTEDEEIQASYETVSQDEIRALAEEGVSKSTELVTRAHLSLTGASGKVGLYHDASTEKWYLPHGDAPSTHIVKQSHVRLSDIVVNERMMMLAASSLGIETASCDILNLGSGTDTDILFSTARYDRVFSQKNGTISGLKRPARLHQEDFAQAMGILPSMKYETSDSGYFKRVFDVVRQNSTDPIHDQLSLWDRIIFNYLIGNTDAHIKNISLLYDEDLRHIRLAPAYDMVSTVVYSESTRDMSFYIGGELSLDRITDECFERAAEDAGIGRGLAMKRLADLRSKIKPALQTARDMLIDEGFSVAEKIYRAMGENGVMGS